MASYIIAENVCFARYWIYVYMYMPFKEIITSIPIKYVMATELH